MKRGSSDTDGAGCSVKTNIKTCKYMKPPFLFLINDWKNISYIQSVPKLITI